MAEETVEWKPAASDDAVRKATGKDWAEWRADLDSWAGELDHKTIARRLHEERDVSGWWAQMVTNGWEVMTGRREKHQRACGNGGQYQASASKTINVAPGEIERAFEMPAFADWGPAGVFERCSGTQGKSINGQWSGGGRLAVWLVMKSETKTQISMSHEKIESAEDCEHWKSEWRAAFGRLKTRLETKS
jgi:hypothetical protein